MRARRPTPDLDPMLVRYALVDWECHRSGRFPRWGNMTVKYTAAGRDTVVDQARELAAKALSDPEDDEVLPSQIRIVGFFPIP